MSWKQFIQKFYQQKKKVKNEFQNAGVSTKISDRILFELALR